MTKRVYFSVLVSLHHLACSGAPDFSPPAGAAGEPSAGAGWGGGLVGGAAGQPSAGGSELGAGSAQGGAGATAGGLPGGAAGVPTAGATSAGVGGNGEAGGVGGSGGSPSSGGSGFSGGSAGTQATEPNACEPPTATFRDCTGACLAGDSCSSCGISKDHLGDASTQYERSVVIKANAGGGCAEPNCDGTAFMFSLYAGACARFTSMPVPLGRTAPRFAQNTEAGAPRCEAWSACLVVEGYGSSPHRLANTYVSSGNVDAWVHAEAAALVNGACPLVCP